MATDAYVFGYPLVLVDATRAADGVINRFSHSRSLPTPMAQRVVKPNLDTLYSSAWLDLTTEPMVLQVPAMDKGRYWLMQILDAWTNTVHDPSSVRPQTQSGQQVPPFTYLLTGPGWSGTEPAGLTHLPMPTNTVRVSGRVQVNGVEDLATVFAIQDQMKLAPLSTWQANPHISTPGLTNRAGTATPPPGVVAGMDGVTFFTKLCQLMATDPPAPADQSTLRRLSSAGIAPGGRPTADLTILNAATRAAQQQIHDYKDPATQNINGWTHSSSVGSYGTNYKLRASTALHGLFANLPVDALYFQHAARADNNGVAQRFRVRFPAGQLPPVGAFWSITAYGPDSYLIPNSAHIYAVGHQVPTRTNPDGSTDIVIQSADPGPMVPEGNWLPIPASGHFSLTLRLYAPEPDAANGRWHPPTVDISSSS